MQSGAQTVRSALKQWCKQAKWHCVLLLMHIITSHNNTLPTNTGVSICRHFETNMTQTKSLRVWIPDGWVFIVIVLDKVSLFWLINSSNLDFKMCWFWRCWASRWMCLTVCFVALLLLLVVAIMTGWWTALSYQVRASELKFVFGQWLQDECYFQIRLRCVGVLKSSPPRNKREKQERRVHSCTNSRFNSMFLGTARSASMSRFPPGSSWGEQNKRILCSNDQPASFPLRDVCTYAIKWIFLCFSGFFHWGSDLHENWQRAGAPSSLLPFPSFFYPKIGHTLCADIMQESSTAPDTQSAKIWLKALARST